jgi:hypothetical protein
MLEDGSFCYYTDYESIWFSGDEKALETEPRMIASPELMLTVVWNPPAFQVLGFPPKGLDVVVHTTCLTSWIPRWLLSSQTSSIRFANSLSIRIALLSTRQNG